MGSDPIKCDPIMTPLNVRRVFLIQLCQLYCQLVDHLQLPGCQPFQNGDDFLDFVRHVYPPLIQKKHLG